MIQHFLKAISQLDDKRFRSVLIRGLLSAIVCLAAVTFAARYGMAHVDIPWWETPDWLLNIGSAALFMGASWFLFPAIATAVMGLFLDDVIDAVEETHYPHARAPRSIGVTEAAWLSVKLFGWILLVNLLALPFYIALLFTAIGPLILFVALNGYLLGREYFEMVALRHMRAKQAAKLRRAWRGDMFLLGVGVTGLFMIPVINLIAPLVGAAAAVHSFHTVRREY
ncbi:MAG: EI24 domain-containing protein [Pseudomonadota bacterium]